MIVPEQTSPSGAGHPVLRRVPLVAGWMVVVIGLTVLMGWATDTRGLISLFPGWIGMRVNTAVCFILSGIALLLNYRANRLNLRGIKGVRLIAILLGGVVFMIGALTELEYLFSLDFGIDPLFFRQRVELLTHQPARISPISAFNFICVGTGLVLLAMKRALIAVQVLSGYVIFCALVILTGTSYGIEALLASGHYTAVALHTSLAFCLLCGGIFCATGDVGLTILLWDRGIAGTVVRRLIPTAVLIPVALSGICILLERAGVVSLELGLSIFSIGTIVLFAALVWWSASFLRHSEIGTREAEGRLRESLQRFTLVAESMPQIIWTARPDGYTDYFNQRWFDYTGLSIEQTRDWGWKMVVHPDDLQNCLDKWTTSLATGSDYEVEYRFRRASDGTFRWHLGRAFALRNEAGRIVQWVGTCTDIDDQKRARSDLEERVTWRTKELGRAREALQAVLDSSTQVSIIATNPDGLITIFNRGAEEMLGYRAEEMVNKHSPAILHVDAEIKQRSRELTDELGRPIEGFDVFVERARLGKHDESEWTYVRKDGTRLTVNLIVTATYDARGNVAGFLGIATDITSRNEAEKTLRSQALILDLANDTIFIRDRNDRITYWNQGAQRLYGWKKEEAVGKVTHELFVTSFPQPLPEIQQELSDRGHWEGELVHTDRLGRRLTVASSWTLQRDESGQPIAVIEINHDLSARKVVETELEKNRQRFNAIVNTSLDGIIVYQSVRDADGEIIDFRFLTINPAAERLSSIPGSEMIGKRMREVFSGPQIDSIFKRFKTIVEENKPDEFEHMSSREGWSRWYRIAGVKLSDGLAISYTEITARKQYEQELHEARDRAERADSAKSDFLANMSHEIRTPMNGVIGMTGLLLDTPLDHEQRNLAETIRTSADSLLGLLNDILDFSKIEAGKLTFEDMEFDIRKVVEDTLEVLAGQAQAKGLELVGGVDLGVPSRLRGDPGRVQQVLTNIVGNAVKFTKTGEVTLRVTPAHVTDLEIELRVEVRDTGIGIKDEVVPKLFQAFSQADSSTSRKFGGTGLGLAICQRLAESMNGSISVESKLGVGSVFIVRLKFQRAASLAPEPTSPPEFTDTSVLVLDDNKASNEFLIEQVRAWRMPAEGVFSGEELLKRLHVAARAGKPISIAIIDTQIPGTDSMALVRKINDDASLSATRLVLLTPFGKPLSADDLKAVHASACCAKPVRQSALFDCMVHALARTTVFGEPRQRKTLVRSTPEVTQRPERILLAEDNPVNQQVALGNLRKLGFTADLAQNGLDVLAAIEAKRYDIVLMDCQMPEMDGYEVTQEIRKRAQNGAGPWIIAMTANVMVGDREKCLEAGMNDYVGKPLRRAELSAAIERAAAQMQERPAADPKFLEEMTDDPKELSELVDIFARTAPKTMEQIEKAMADENAPALKIAAHTLKGSSGTMGGTPLREICAEIERLGRENNVLGARKLVLTAKKELDRLVKALDTYRRT